MKFTTYTNSGGATITVAANPLFDSISDEGVVNKMAEEIYKRLKHEVELEKARKVIYEK